MDDNFHEGLTLVASALRKGTKPNAGQAAFVLRARQKIEDLEKKVEILRGLDEALHENCTLAENHPTLMLLDEVRGELRILKEVRGPGTCQCSDDDACRFVQEREAALAEVERLKVIVHEFAEVTEGSFKFDGSTVQATLKSHFVPIIAEAFYDILKEHDATNYVEMRLGNDEISMLVTVQRLDGKTPHQLRKEAEDKLDQLRALAEAVCNTNVNNGDWIIQVEGERFNALDEYLRTTDPKETL